MLCLDDYFMIETEKIEKDPETGKRVKKKVGLNMCLLCFRGLSVITRTENILFTKAISRSLGQII